MIYLKFNNNSNGEVTNKVCVLNSNCNNVLIALFLLFHILSNPME